MSRSTLVPFVLLAAALTGACGSSLSNPTGPSNPSAPTQISEAFEGTLTVNGATTYPFAVQQTGTVTATLSALSPDDAIVGLQLGTWNSTTASCAVPSIYNDNATSGASVIGSATSTANFCVRIADVGKLAGPTDYVITVTHF